MYLLIQTAEKGISDLLLMGQADGNLMAVLQLQGMNHCRKEKTKGDKLENLREIYH